MDAMMREIELALEVAVWTQRGDFVEGGATVSETVQTPGKWNFKVFSQGMDPSRRCEVMATGRKSVVRLPPALAEKWFSVAKEKAMSKEGAEP